MPSTTSTIETDERPVRERPQVQQGAAGALQAQLAGHEHGQRQPRRPAVGSHGGTSACAAGGLADAAQPEHQAAERRARTAPPRARRAGPGGLATAPAASGRPAASATSAIGSTIQNIQRQPSAVRIDPGHGGADRRRDRDDDRDRAHRGAAALGRHEPHHRGHQQRHHHRGAGGLHDPAGQQHGKPGRERGDERARAEQRSSTPGRPAAAGSAAAGTR